MYYYIMYYINTLATAPSNIKRYLQVVEGKERLWLPSLLLDVLDAVPPRLLRVHDDGVHVLPQHLGDGDLVLLLRGLAQVDQTAVLHGETRRRREQCEFRRCSMRTLQKGGGVVGLVKGGVLPYHGARVQPLDALHDLGLALLAAVLLPVDPGVPQLLHDLRGGERGGCESLTADNGSHTPICI